MTEHPLTDEICDQIQDSIHPCDPENMRTAYDRGRDDQLKQVLEWIDCIGRFEGYNLDFHSDCNLLIRDIQKAMRPQQ
jgi:hypothetical protein